MSKKKILSRIGLLAILVSAVTAIGFGLEKTVYADFSQGYGDTEAGACGDNWCFCTTYGATWQYYEWDESLENENGDIVIPNDYGDNPYGRDPGLQTSVTQGATIPSDCKDKGGYYRYAMVSRCDGQQHGVAGIGGQNSTTFNSKFFGGGMTYRGSDSEYGGLDWGTVEQAYNSYADNQDSYNGSVDLGWFCGGDPNKLKDDEKEDEDKKDTSGSGSGDPQCNAWMPDSYNDSDEYQGKTSVIIGVQNMTINSGWYHLTQTEPGPRYGTVWAKPTDQIQWKYCYYPGVQRSAFELVTVDNVHEEPLEMHPTVNHIINKKFSEAYPWKNDYKVWTTNLQPGSENTNKTVSKAIGDDKVDVGVMPESGSYGVQPRVQPALYMRGQPQDPGRTLTGFIQTIGGPTQVARQDGQHHTWQCNWGTDAAKCGSDCVAYNADGSCGASVPRSCYLDTCEHAEDYYWNSHSDGTQSDSAEVKVPFNYENSASVAIQNELLYSGETATIVSNQAQTYVQVGTRNNNVTQGNYATYIPGGMIRLMSYISASPDGSEQRGVGSAADASGNGLCKYLNVKWSLNRCDQLESDDRTLNPTGNMGGETYIPNYSGQTYSVYDEAAGNYFCVAAAVYPYTVRNDQDMNASGTNQWYISKPSCVIMAKRPTFQVWGAGVYSAGNIETNLSLKNNVKNFVAWAPKSWQGGDIYYGSWGELTVSVGGTAQHIASGAGTGHTPGGPTGSSSGLATDLGNPGGVKDAADYCLRSTMSLANVGCMSGAVGGFRGTAVRESTLTDKSALVSRFSETDNSHYTLETHDGGSYTIGGQTVTGTKVIKVSNGTAIISGNIEYPDINYTSALQIPQTIIYARDIEIGCNVTRIDAVLIADNVTDTCREAGDKSQTYSDKRGGERSHQLEVRGAIITGSLTLNRSYGISAGEYTMAPAELVNYDSSIYLWANSQAEGSNSGQFTETASHELAPRY